MVVVALCLLLAKGFSFALPNISPSNVRRTMEKLERNFSCKPGEILQVIKECSPCSSHQVKILPICSPTGNVEEVRCNDKDATHLLSCPFAKDYEAKKFFVFETCMAGVAILANLLVWWRRRSNDKYMYQKLKRQISNLNSDV